MRAACPARETTVSLARALVLVLLALPAASLEASATCGDPCVETYSWQSGGASCADPQPDYAFAEGANASGRLAGHSWAVGAGRTCATHNETGPNATSWSYRAVTVHAHANPAGPGSSPWVVVYWYESAFQSPSWSYRICAVGVDAGGLAVGPETIDLGVRCPARPPDQPPVLP